MSRIFVLLYGLFSYVVGLGGLVYFILFVGGWSFLPLHIDSSAPGPLGRGVLINVALIVLFGLQHSVMARPTFKRRFAQSMPRAAERSTYVLLSGVMMLVICLFWQPLAGVVWRVENPIGRLLLTGGYLFGWAFAVVSTFVINHFELFGLQQIYLNLRNKPEPAPFFTDRFLYKLVRHPLQLGILIGLWVTPTMSMSHLFLAITMSIYIFIGLYFEEKDLIGVLGATYTTYKTRVPKILPIPNFGRAPKVPVVPNPALKAQQ